MDAIHYHVRSEEQSAENAVSGDDGYYQKGGQASVGIGVKSTLSWRYFSLNGCRIEA